MKDFKAGDRVKIVDDGYVRPHASDAAKDLKLTKFKQCYGLWSFGSGSGSGVGNNKEGVIINVIKMSCGVAGVEIDNEDVQIVIEVEGLELIKRVPKPVQDLSSPFPTLREFLGV